MGDFKRVALAAGYSLGTVFIYQVWREKELAVIRQDSLELCRRGYVVLPSHVSPSQKREAWESHLLSAMIAHWKKTPGFIYEDPATWPAPANGKNKEMSSTMNKVPGLPRLTTDNFRVQAICSFLVDPSLTRVHFGANTHPKLLLLANPLYLLLGGPQNYNRLAQAFSVQVLPLELQGSDQSWHIVSVASKNGKDKVGQPLPNGAHIDGGENSVFTKSGLPAISPPPTAGSATPSSFEDRLLLTLCHQLAIIFYAETPGFVGPEQGATGFYPQSHLALAKALKDIAPATIPWDVHSRAMSEMASDPLATILQPSLPDGTQLLCFGFTMHSAMWASRAMNDGNVPLTDGAPAQGDIRIVQNSKIKASAALRTAPHEVQLRALAAIPQDSFLRVLARGDPREMETVFGYKDDSASADRVLALSQRYATAAMRK